jgi:hypothetical protein
VINEEPSNSLILDIKGPSLTFPEIRLEKGKSLGLYTYHAELMSMYFFKLITEPEKYAKEVKINGSIANGINWIGRVYTHIVIPHICQDTILNLLKKKPKRRDLIFIGAKKSNVYHDELPYISKIISSYKSECSILVISDSIELLKATVNEVMDDTGKNIIFSDKLRFNFPNNF